MTRVLLTSFEPFAGHRLNSSLEVGRAVAAAPPAGITLDWLVLPVVAGRCVELAWARVEEFQPDLVLALGQADSATSIEVERLAVNVSDFWAPDNAGQQPRDEPVVVDGPAAYFVTLPARPVVTELAARQIPARLSYSAGTYVCNHLLYGLLHRAVVSGCPHRTGFLHLPLLPEQAEGQAGGRPTSEQLLDGVRLTMMVGLGVAGAVSAAAEIHTTTPVASPDAPAG